MVIAKRYVDLPKDREDEIRAGFYVRLALTLLNGGLRDYCRKSISIAAAISKEHTRKFIRALPCGEDAILKIESML